MRFGQHKNLSNAAVSSRIGHILNHWIALDHLVLYLWALADSAILSWSVPTSLECSFCASWRHCLQICYSLTKHYLQMHNFSISSVATWLLLCNNNVTTSLLAHCISGNYSPVYYSVLLQVHRAPKIIEAFA